MEKDFFVTKAILESVLYFEQHDPDRVESIRIKIEEYLSRLERLSLRDSRIENLIKRGFRLRRVLLSFCYLLIGVSKFRHCMSNDDQKIKIQFERLGQIEIRAWCVSRCR